MAINITFSGAGFMGIYHAGVVACLSSYGTKILENIKYYAGCSAGAMCAVNLACGIKVEKGMRLFMDSAAKVRDTTLFGPFTAPLDFVKTIRNFYTVNLSPNAYKSVSGRLFISLTRVSDWKNVIVSEFESNRELIDAIICTTFIPFYSGIKPPTYRGVSYVDGSLTDNLLQDFEGTNITVSVFSGDCDICPDDGGQKSNMILDMNNSMMEVTRHNAYRLLRTLFPLDSSELTKLCRQGFRDTLKYMNSKYPDMLSFDVDIVSVPYCCGGAFTDDDNENRTMTCFCGGSEEDGYAFNKMEKTIAREKVISSLVLPQDLYQTLQEIENIVGEKDVIYLAVSTIFQLLKWLANPYYYVTKHICDFVDDLFRVSLPLLEKYSSKNIVAKKIFKMSKDALSAYHGSGKFEWHPSLGKEKQVDIEKTRKRLLSAQQSFVALRNDSHTHTTSVSIDGSELSHYIQSSHSSFLSRVVFEDDELLLDSNDDDNERKYSSRVFRLLMKFGNALTSKVEEDYGSDLDYRNHNDVYQCCDEFWPASDDEEEYLPVF